MNPDASILVQRKTFPKKQGLLCLQFDLELAPKLFLFSVLDPSFFHDLIQHLCKFTITFFANL